MRCTILAAALSLAVGSTAAQAQASTLSHFTRADFERALTESGASITSAAGSERIAFTLHGGVTADALLLACGDDKTKTRCLGSSLLATFQADADTTRERKIEAVNKNYYKENFGRAHIEPDGVIAVRIYMIADGGITRENHATQIGMWFALVVDSFGYLYPENGAWHTRGG